MTTQANVHHTPGPWSIDAHDNVPVFVGAPSAGNVCHVLRNALVGDTMANARLIAAAPELLAALETMLVDHDRRHPSHFDSQACEESANETDPDHLNLDCVSAMTARAAIRKVLGDA